MSMAHYAHAWHAATHGAQPRGAIARRLRILILPIILDCPRKQNSILFRIEKQIVDDGSLLPSHFCALGSLPLPPPQVMATASTSSDLPEFLEALTPALAPAQMSNFPQPLHRPPHLPSTIYMRFS